MQEVTIPRSGMPPLRFRGEEIARVDGQHAAGGDHNRWHEIVVYRTAGGTYAIAIDYHSQWQGELSHHFAATCADPGEVNRIVQGYDPTANVVGYPPGDGYARKQDRLIADICRRYRALATELYEQLGVEFAETIP